MTGATSIARPQTDHNRPEWAEKFTEEEGGIRWSRKREIEARPALIDGPPGVLNVEAYQYDRVEVDSDGVQLVRGDVEVIVYDDVMTVDQARTFAQAILDVVDAVETSVRSAP